MKVLLLNQYDAESGAPTGRILAELGDGLRRSGHDVVFLYTDRVYGKSRRGVSRILRELWAHALLFLRGLGSGKIDAVISLTSPACLAVTADLIARFHRARHFHWAMDIYPEVGIRLGELTENALTRTLASLMIRAYRNARRVVALDEDMQEYFRTIAGIEAVVVEPFSPQVTWPSDIPPSTRRWLYSGNFGRAHEIDILLQVQVKLEERGVEAKLVLQGQGAQFISSQDAAHYLKLKRVEWRPPAPAEALGRTLLETEVLVVTRKAAMKGLLLPSKLILAELSGRTILWIGDTDGHTARRLGKAGHGVFAIGDIEPIAEWLAQRFTLPSVPSAPLSPETSREQSIRTWEKLLES